MSSPICILRPKYVVKWAVRAMARSFMEDKILYQGLEQGLVEVPLDPSQPRSHKKLNGILRLGRNEIQNSLTTWNSYVLSYVHQAANSTYGLAKLPEPAERELIDGIRRRARADKSSRVFIWSDQTIKGRVSDEVWLKVGVYAYAVLPGIVVPTPRYTTRLWPLVEYSLLEACSGFILDFSSCKTYARTTTRSIVKCTPRRQFGHGWMTVEASAVQVKATQLETGCV